MYNQGVPIESSFTDALARVRRGLAQRPPRALEVIGYRRAAVLVPLLDRKDGPTLLFTRRSEALPHHAGEISFPGGGLLPRETAEKGALREAEEEVGLRPSDVSLLGRLDDLVSVARFVVTPVVAAVASPPEAFVPAPGEVEEHFELPLSLLLDRRLRRATLWDPAQLSPEVADAVRKANVPPEDVDPETGFWRIWSFHADEARVVWGLTGRVLASLLDWCFEGG